MTAWVIERYYDSVLHYWDGNQGDGSWAMSYDRACKFADSDSASKVLSRLLGGIGRVAQHGYIDAARGEG